MDTKVFQVAKEVAREYNLPCALCGEEGYDEIHHEPGRRKNGAAPEILGVTLFPLHKKCHMYYPKIDHLQENIESEGNAVLYWYAAIAHISKCFARGLYNKPE